DYLADPVRVAVAPAATTVERVEQSVIFVPSERKRDLITTLLHDPSFERVLVFTRTKHGADRVTRHLVGAGINAAAIHGNKPQPQRERALARFRRRDGRRVSASALSPDFEAETAACSSPPTSRRAASMWKACRTSSISSCRTFRKTMCTAS